MDEPEYCCLFSGLEQWFEMKATSTLQMTAFYWTKSAQSVFDNEISGLK